MAISFHFSSPFEEARLKIEQHLYDSVLGIENDLELAIESVDRFAKSIDRLADTLEQMYKTTRPEDLEGEKSFPIRDGQYRVFYKISALNGNDMAITFTDIDHNKQSNLDRFPMHQMITFHDEN